MNKFNLEAVNQAIKSARYTYTEMAEILGITTRALRNKLTCDNEFKVSEIITIAVATKTNVKNYFN